jgi:peptidoglycan/LPS O-acetylase OafA/YrhL
MYLFHFFVAIVALSFFTPARHPGWFSIAVPFYWSLSIGLTYALARLSWVTLEAPLLRLKRYFPYHVD